MRLFHFYEIKNVGIDLQIWKGLVDMMSFPMFIRSERIATKQRGRSQSRMSLRLSRGEEGNFQVAMPKSYHAY
jgi:hypothetical protein